MGAILYWVLVITLYIHILGGPIVFLMLTKKKRKFSALTILIWSMLIVELLSDIIFKGGY